MNLHPPGRVWRRAIAPTTEDASWTIREAAYGIGACQLREQDHDAARVQFERAVARDSRSAVALVGLGSALLGLNRAADAIVPLERAVAIEPAMDDGWYVLGRAYQAAGRTGQAQQAFATVERLRTERPR